MSSPEREDEEGLSSSPVHYSAEPLTPSSGGGGGVEPLSSSSSYHRTPGRIPSSSDHPLTHGGSQSSSRIVPGSPAEGIYSTPSSWRRGDRGDVGGNRARWGAADTPLDSMEEFAMEPVSGALTSSSSTTSRPGRRGRGRRGLSETSSSTPSRGGRRRRGGDDSEPPSSSGGTIGLGSSTLRSSGDPGSSSAGDHLRTENFFWGSSVSVQAVQESFRRFLQDFREPPNTTGGDEVDPRHSDEPLYPRLIWDAVVAQQDSINLNTDNLRSWEDGELYQHLLNYPQDVIHVMDFTATQFMREMILEDERRLRQQGMDIPMEYEQQLNISLQVRPFNLSETTNMRDLNPSDIDTLVAIRGMVIRCSSVIPDTKVAFFSCSQCPWTVEVRIEEGRIAEPTFCEGCSAQQSMQIIHNRGQYADKQLVRVQETPDSVPEGETPHTLSVYTWDNLVDVVQPGDRVIITGVFRAAPSRVSSRQRAVRSLYNTYLDAIHFQRHKSSAIQAETRHADPESEFYTPWDESDELRDTREARERQLYALSQEENLYERLAESLAPSIYGMQDVKKGVLCMLFGGTNIDAGAMQGRFRGEINILLVGDPGTSKSQLLQYVHKLAPRGIYTSGKGSSAVGLTAYVTKDPETGEFVLESGALVLSDRGICCIDEFDKMSDSTRSILHEVMEQQTVSIAKAGIVASLNARTSILASANPIESRYNPNLSVVKNIQLGPTLLSRFDLIYLVLDQPNAERDRRLAAHLVKMYYQDGHLSRDYSSNADPQRSRDTMDVDSSSSSSESDTDSEDRDSSSRRRRRGRGDGDGRDESQRLIPIPLLAQYISYARQHFRPRLTQSARDLLVEEYTKIRKLGRRSGTVAATPRQLESLVRLSEALARMHFRNSVLVSDVQEAVRLMQVATHTTATDEHGRIDMDQLTTGLGAGERKRQRQQLARLRELLFPGQAALDGLDEVDPEAYRLSKSRGARGIAVPRSGLLQPRHVLQAFNEGLETEFRIDYIVLSDLLSVLEQESNRVSVQNDGQILIRPY